ncbi:MAG: leucyl/phenylalanyl-tRNA--protein transferase, partial [Deltaproteobacteria bacterium]|nr:leucyl/phenylalanyl-tRNA--protein transferase [Deltaproteobacteria bacterium]
MADDVTTEDPEEFEKAEGSVLNDIVHISDGLDTGNLITAYSSGIFPWPEDDEMPILWFCPDPRGILKYSNLHVSKSLKKSIRQNNFTVCTDTCFDEVIDKCAFQKRAGQPGTWITDNTLAAYKDFHKAGYAHSVEIFKDGELAGGLYGVFIKNVFSGESMFHTHKDTSKIALVVLMTLLDQLGITWIDT